MSYCTQWCIVTTTPTHVPQVSTLWLCRILSTFRPKSSYSFWNSLLRSAILKVGYCFTSFSVWKLSHSLFMSRSFFVPIYKTSFEYFPNYTEWFSESQIQRLLFHWVFSNLLDPHKSLRTQIHSFSFLLWICFKISQTCHSSLFL